MQPLLLVSVKVAVYNPIELYLCSAFRIKELLLIPESGSPKFHDQRAIFPDAMEDVSLKMAEASLRQTSGEIKPGLGNGLVVIVFNKGASLIQPLSVSKLNFTVYVFAVSYL